MTDYVYFIRPQGASGPVKIGYSNWPKQRLIDLSIWSPVALELIGAVPGTLKDEAFLHACFAESHSHHEWFHWSAELEQTIAMAIRENSIAPLRHVLTVKGTIRPRRTLEQRQRVSYSQRIRCAEDRLRVAGATAYLAPDDINAIMCRWSAHRRGIEPITPTTDEFGRMEEFLADPAKYAVIPTWDEFETQEAAE